MNSFRINTVIDTKRQILLLASCLTIGIANDILCSLILLRGAPELLPHPVLTEARGWELLFLVTLGPLLETVIFQHLLITRLDRLLRQRYRSLTMLISAAVFCLLHDYSSTYQIAMIIPSLLLSYLYFRLYISSGQKRALTLTYLFHALNNLLVVWPLIF